MDNVMNELMWSNFSSLTSPNSLCYLYCKLLVPSLIDIVDAHRGEGAGLGPKKCHIKCNKTRKKVDPPTVGKKQYICAIRENEKNYFWKSN